MALWPNVCLWEPKLTLLCISDLTDSASIVSSQWSEVSAQSVPLRRPRQIPSRPKSLSMSLHNVQFEKGEAESAQLSSLHCLVLLQGRVRRVSASVWWGGSTLPRAAWGSLSRPSSLWVRPRRRDLWEKVSGGDIVRWSYHCLLQVTRFSRLTGCQSRGCPTERRYQYSKISRRDQWLSSSPGEIQLRGGKITVSLPSTVVSCCFTLHS